MSSKKPILRQAAWSSLIPQLLFMGLLIFIFTSLTHSSFGGAFLGCIVYLTISVVLRNFIPRNHRKGIALFKSEKYAEAIEEYKKSYAFFTKHAWIDKYRFITLLSSSRVSYTEMALLNTAFCYAQIGDGKQAKEYYEKAIKQFPNSEIAKSSLKMISAGENSASPNSD